MTSFGSVLPFLTAVVGALVGFAAQLIVSTRNVHIQREQNDTSRISALAAKESAESSHIEALDDVIKTYREEVERYKAEREELRATLESKREEIRQELERKIAALQLEINDLKTTKEDELREVRLENTKLKEEVARLRKRVVILERKDAEAVESAHLGTLDAEVRARKVV